MEGLDLKDRKILYELDINARQPDSRIAKKVGLSREVVRYRIHRLQEEGYINYFLTTLNSMKLGFIWFRTFFKFQNLGTQKEEEILEWLRRQSSWMTQVEGPWDVNTGIFCRTVYEFRDILSEFFMNYGTYLERYWTSIVTRMWHYHRGYLLNKKESKADVMGYEPGEKYVPVTIDRTDYKILQKLAKNARMKTIDIAREIEATEIMVRHRIKKMIENGVILGFRPFLNINKLGYSYFKVHIKLQNLTEERKNHILSFIHQHLHIIYLTELVGGADVEIEFQVRTNDELYQYLKELRERFPDLIRDYEFMQYTKEYKFTYLPEKGI